MNVPHSCTGRRPRRRDLLATLTLPALLLLCVGCPFSPQDTTSSDVTDSTATVLDGSENSSLASATSLGLSSGNQAIEFRGSITSNADIDVYDLGTLSEGDRLFVDVRRTTKNLDPTAAVFDSREYMVAFNDDRDQDGTDLDPQLDIVIRGATDTYYLAIIAYPGNITTGDYSAAVRVERAVGDPGPRAQLVYLNWAGGENILIENVGLFNLAPFSATDVGLAEDQTAALKDRVQQIVEERYADYNLLVLNSDDNSEPPLAHSTVHFGGTSYEAFAISEQIDTFNEDPSDQTIVFSGSYREVFRTDPTPEQMAQALGNTVAHELGHLLGLVHTHDCNSLMDTTCLNDRLLSPQVFKTAELDDSVFPFGWQDAEEILGWILGFVGL